MEEAFVYPLTDVHAAMGAIGYEPGYAYDDLIFSNDAIFIVQFNKKNLKELILFTNQDLIKSEEERIRSKFPEAAKKKGFKIVQGASFSMKQKEETEEIELVFN